MLTLVQASELMPEEIRLSPRNLAQYIMGRLSPPLRAVKLGKTWIIDEADFNEWLALYRQTDRSKAASVRKGWPRRKR